MLIVKGSVKGDGTRGVAANAAVGLEPEILTPRDRQAIPKNP
eukprot:CAMPEP_0117687668 /NCGR_PEP_ID=MMETSP0804-20121206/23278_1 /TAXON_ID=1074897 /ORGANISM="Tetraselmis astigmatica, Strain CCMP880" /LENGTH=41 /DNA_ID= /DNA_START= /DNA_END= /DNA_ORIENTATION=